MELREAVVQPVAPCDDQRHQGLMQAHHYLGALPKRSGAESLALSTNSVNCAAATRMAAAIPQR